MNLIFKDRLFVVSLVLFFVSFILFMFFIQNESVLMYVTPFMYTFFSSFIARLYKMRKSVDSRSIRSFNFKLFIVLFSLVLLSIIGFILISSISFVVVVVLSALALISGCVWLFMYE